jgi:8-oxo-dGTP pyrophosphatase MutT (NUDIX family)
VSGTVRACDNASAGVLIERAGRYLMLERARPPAGIAPAAGHVFDEHSSYADAAAAEVREELGLTVVSLEAVTGGWRANRCRRGAGPRGYGHEWRVFRAAVTGDVSPSADETRGAIWLGAGDVEALAGRTIACARGQLDPAEFAARPGIEPVWVQWLADAGIITASPDDLAAVDVLAST